MNTCMPEMLQRFIQLYESHQRFVIFDVETVGNYPPIIVEIGAIEAGIDYKNNSKIFQTVLQFCPPSWTPYSVALGIHKIPTYEIENGKNRISTFENFLSFIKDSVLICHTHYDVNAMKKNLETIPEMKEASELPIWAEYLDSCRLARYICPFLEHFNLPYLAEYFKITNPQAHRALADACTTKQLLIKLLHYFYTEKNKKNP